MTDPGPRTQVKHKMGQKSSVFPEKNPKFYFISKSTLKNEHGGTQINVFTHVCFHGNHAKSRKTHLLLLNEAEFFYFFHVSGKYTFLFNRCFICLAIIAFKVQICPTYMVHLNSCRQNIGILKNLKNATVLGMYIVISQCWNTANQIISENVENRSWRE